MIDLPIRLRNLLQGISDETSAAVGAVISAVFPMLQRNEAPFFPDYTDHGVIHIENVLNTCENLIADEAWTVFTREDAAVLTIAALGHDLGMLLNTEGFKALVAGDLDAVAAITPDEELWPKLWLEFQLDARRFDGSTLIDITGSPEPIGIKELDCDNLSERGRKVAGEFLRRHHHRLAYEIIVGGMPSGNGRVDLFSHAPKFMREIAGVIAWSHGVSIRQSLDVLFERERTGHREFRHVHPALLICLVRLADYLDLDSGRAPATILSLKSLKSPISKREWWSHKAFVDCHSHAEDPESLHVIVDPSALTDVAIFSVIEEKIDGIQKEIDGCWAVLGEVYGRFPPLNRLGIRVRRIRSDIRLPSITNQLPFVPHKAGLESARSDLLKLLIEPLYGDDPGIGIRELMQNAIDAVRERQFLQGKTPCEKIDTEELAGDIVIKFDKEGDDYWVSVSDRGVGMTWASVCKYYLTAGASFRQSDAWKRRFTDDAGVSQVLRSGRFGIGVLAAFLIGDRVRVSTRHAEQPEDRGIEFEFGLDDTIIEMRWKRKKAGTTVKVRTTESIIKKLFQPFWAQEMWDWYCLDEPIVIRQDLQGNPLKQQYHLPSLNKELPLAWHQVDVAGFQSVQWTYRSKSPSLVCNGIVIKQARIDVTNVFSPWEMYTRTSHLILAQPRVSVFDPDGKLPLNLSRSDLAGYYEQLYTSISFDQCVNFLAFLLVRGPRTSLLEEDQFFNYCRPSYPISYAYSYQGLLTFGFLFSSEKGFGISDPSNVGTFINKPALIIRGKGNTFPKIGSALKREIEKVYGALLCDTSDGTLRQFDSWHRMLALTPTDRPDCLFPFKGISVKGIRVIMTTNDFERFKTKQRKYVVKGSHIEQEGDDRAAFTVGECPDAADCLGALFDALVEKGFGIESLTECHFDQRPQEPHQSFLANVWHQVIGGPIIPFNEEDRRVVISRFPSKFQLHLDEWKKTREGATRGRTTTIA